MGGGGGSRTGFDVSFLFMNIKGGVRYLFNVFLAFKASYFIELTFPATRSGGNISGILMLLFLHVQLPTRILHGQKLHFIAYKSVSLFLIRNEDTRSFEHFIKIGVSATMNTKLEKQRLIKFLLL